SATDWTLNAVGTGGSPTNLSGSTPVDSTGTFKADTYTLSETGGSPGYTGGNWVCTGGGTQVGNQITVGLGQNVTCTINNNDNPPALHLRKTVTNDNGGTAVENAGMLTASGSNGLPTNTSDTTPNHYNYGLTDLTYTITQHG